MNWIKSCKTTWIIRDTLEPVQPCSKKSLRCIISKKKQNVMICKTLKRRCFFIYLTPATCIKKVSTSSCLPFCHITASFSNTLEGTICCGKWDVFPFLLDDFSYSVIWWSSCRLQNHVSFQCSAAWGLKDHSHPILVSSLVPCTQRYFFKYFFYLYFLLLYTAQKT